MLTARMNNAARSLGNEGALEVVFDAGEFASSMWLVLHVVRYLLSVFTPTPN